MLEIETQLYARDRQRHSSPLETETQLYARDTHILLYARDRDTPPR